MSEPGHRPRQLTFDLPVAARHGIEDFLVGASNEAAFNFIATWPQWPEAWLRLVGPDGAGKTHLAAIWADMSGAAIVPVGKVTGETVPELTAGTALVVEDCDRDLRDEAALFHVMNALRAKGGYVLLTARAEPDGWGVQIPDLRSRLRLAPQVTIAPPDDGLLRALLVKLFIDRQLVVDVGIIEMLALRMERSFAAARRLVDALDRLSLERARRVTRVLAAEALAELFPDEGV